MSDRKPDFWVVKRTIGKQELWRTYIGFSEFQPERSGRVGWCWWADGSMGCAPTYEDACRAAEAAIYRRIANRMAVM